MDSNSTGKLPVIPFPSWPAIELWDFEQCAKELRMSERTLRNLGKAGPPKVRLGGRVWYRPEGVRKWLEARER